MRQLANPAGTVIPSTALRASQVRSYEPFGKQLSAAGNPLTKYAFTGEWQDPTGLIYLRARYYDPATGRFLTSDPFAGLFFSPQTQSPYVYTANRPITYADPTGLFWEQISSLQNCFVNAECDQGELVAGVGLVVLVDGIEAAVLVVISIVGSPIAAIKVAEVTGPILIPVNLIGAYLAFDSNCIQGFNREDWGL